MKNTLKLASLSLAMAAIVSLPAYAASSVRSFGGAGMYNSAASASGSTSASASTGSVVKPSSATSAAKPSVAAPSRGGSVRVTPASGKTGVTVKPTASTTSTAANRGSSLPRLSVGSHIGSNALGGGGSSYRPDVDPGVSGDDFEDFKSGLGDMAYENDVKDEHVADNSSLYQMVIAENSLLRQIAELLADNPDGNWILVNNNGTVDMYEIAE